MIYLSRKNIDIEKWNACIEASSSLPYAYSWYLDEMCPAWDALILEKEGRYVACFPVPWKSKLGIKYVYPPFFIQQLGLFTVDDSIVIAPFVEYLAKNYKWVELYLNSEVNGVEVRCNMVLKLDKPYEELAKAYSLNHKRNIQKAHKSGLIIEDSLDAEPTIELFVADKGALFPHLKKEHYNAFSNVCKNAASLGKLQILNAVDAAGEKVCSALFFITETRIVFSFSGNSEKGKQSAALFFILDEMIKRNQNTNLVLDFEGSENEGLQRFYKGFGAAREDYYFYKKNSLPFPLNVVKK